MSKCSMEIHLGMDVSDKSIDFFWLSNGSENGKRCQIANSREALMMFCDKVEDPSKVLVAMARIRLGSLSCLNSEGSRLLSVMPASCQRSG